MNTSASSAQQLGAVGVNRHSAGVTIGACKTPGVLHVAGLMSLGPGGVGCGAPLRSKAMFSELD
jgi:hypothetical protein